MTDERTMLRASVRALVTRFGGSPGTSDSTLWNRIHDQIGGAAVSVPERFGGGGGGIGDLAIVLEELGGGLVRSPMLGTALAASALAASARSGNTDDALVRLLSRIAEDGCAATVVLDSGSVVDGYEAEIVLGVVDGRLVDYDVSTLAVRSLESMDPTRSLAVVDVSGARCTDLGPAVDVLDTALVLAAAEQVGTAARCLERTVEYTSTRVQFGRPVGSFQALKHRMADLHVRVEAARALVHDACASFDDGRCDSGAVAAASISASETLTAVAGDAVQLHGGIGVTWEHDISWYFKRAHGSRFLFGSPREKLARLVAAALP